MRIADIKIGDRHRREMGDIESLAASIAELGLLHPVVVRPDGTVVAGERRIRAFEFLGRDEIPVTVLDIEAMARGELAENAQRKDFTPSELVAISRAIAEEEHRLARDRQRTLNNAPAKLAEANKGDARDRIAARIGAKRTTLAKAKAIVEAAEQEPEKFRKLVLDMDRTGRVNGPYKRLNVIRQAEAIKRSPPPLPTGPFPVIVIDSPLLFDKDEDEAPMHALRPYPEMTIAEIRALPIPNIAASDCVLWLWTTNYHMREVYTILDAWGFEHKTILTWDKGKMGRGKWLRDQTEHALMATRGKPIVTLTNQTTLLHAPRPRENSRKPPEFYARSWNRSARHRPAVTCRCSIGIAQAGCVGALAGAMKRREHDHRHHRASDVRRPATPTQGGAHGPRSGNYRRPEVRQKHVACIRLHKNR
jgi:ParB/RepB/Spo0J family partition protein